MMRVYFISGLAADERVFRHICLPENCDPVHIPWIEPGKNESLRDYACRMAGKIDTSEKFTLIGLSFGGMIATEIANQFHAEKTILISSIPTYEHLPGYYKVAGSLRLHRLIPVSMIKYGAFLKRFFTTETSEDKVMLKGMIRDSNSNFIRWALHAILTWENCQIPSNLFHVHGTKDEILPPRYTKPTHMVKSGGHLMIMNRAGEINEILGEIFNRET